GTLVIPGKYTVDLQLYKDGNLSSLVDPVVFNVVALKNTTMPAEDRVAKVAFQRNVAQLQTDLQVCQNIISETKNKLKYMKVAIERSEQPYGAFYKSLIDIENKLKVIDIDLYGDPVKYDLDMGQPQTPANRIGIMVYEQKYSTSTPTKTHQDNYAIARAEIDTIKNKVETIFNNDIKQLEERLIKSGVAYTPGRGHENKD
ncbi:MAG: hypothetical protein KJN85_13630, partial [Maribacter sp.]|nr:hypothetical protein [Maribacter sp.]